MKIPASLKEFADDIMKDLPPSPTAFRFRDEILEHLEDAQEELERQIDNPNQIKTKLMQQIGDKATLTESFNDFHRSRSSKWWPVELLFYAILFFFGIFTLNLSLMSAYGFGMSLSNLQSIFVIIFSSVIVFMIDYAFFRFVALRLTPHLRSKKGIIGAILLILLPALAEMILWEYGNYSWDMILLDGLLYGLLWLLILGSMGIAFGFIRPRGKNLLASPSAPRIFFAIFLILMASDIMASYLGPDNDPWLRKAIATFSIVTRAAEDGINGMITIIATYMSLYDIVHQAIYAGIFIAAFTMLGVLITISASRAKSQARKDWQRAIGIAIFIYGLCQLLPLSQIPEPQLEWQMPVTEVSKEIEQGELGVFYSYAKTMNTLARYPYYSVCMNDDLFTTTSISGWNRYKIDVKNLSLSEWYPPIAAEKINGRDEMAAGEECRNYSPIPEGFECLDENNDKIEPQVTSDIDESGKEFTMDYIQECHRLVYKGRTIFEESYDGSAGSIEDIKLSDNKQWVMINISNGQTYDQGDPYFYGSHNLYLVDLRDGQNSL